ncbi:MAG: hypothetical protein HQ559_07085, partial [Lentisphaerae bacterium]|nr:hypothetical protein [Lentisphaerota bacterium]
PCYCCTERMAALDASTGRRLMGSRELLRMSAEKTEKMKKELGAEGPKLDLSKLG